VSQDSYYQVQALSILADLLLSSDEDSVESWSLIADWLVRTIPEPLDEYAWGNETAEARVRVITHLLEVQPQPASTMYSVALALCALAVDAHMAPPARCAALDQLVVLLPALAGTGEDLDLIVGRLKEVALDPRAHADVRLAALLLLN
jgi:hypothetical protein